MTDAGLLQLTQWLSPAFPVGSYAYSHGLETAIARGDVTSAADLETWLTDILQFGAGQSDAILLCLAVRRDEAPEILTEHAAALSASRERWQETIGQGRSFAAAVNAANGREIGALPLPVAVGVAAAELGLPPARVAALYLHSLASNLVSAAVRYVPLGQAEGQRVLAALHRVILPVADHAASASLDDIASAAFGADVTSMEHETQGVRLFKT